MTTGQQFTEGQEVIWTGSDHQFSRRVRIREAVFAYPCAGGQIPAGTGFVYDLADLEMPDLIEAYGIPGDQLHPVEGN